MSSIRGLSGVTCGFIRVLIRTRTRVRLWRRKGQKPRAGCGHYPDISVSDLTRSYDFDFDISVNDRPTLLQVQAWNL
jgi:hypothetical protein